MLDFLRNKILMTSNGWQAEDMLQVRFELNTEQMNDFWRLLVVTSQVPAMLCRIAIDIQLINVNCDHHNVVGAHLRSQNFYVGSWVY